MMKHCRRRYILTTALVLTALLPALSPFALATQVTAQVKDVNGTLYTNCNGSANFNGQNTTPGSGPYLLNGSVFQTSAAVFCDSSGNFSVTLADNNVISPGPSQWNFSLCSALGKYPGPQYCFNALITVTGGSQVITSTLQAAAAVLPTAGGGGAVNSVSNVDGTLNISPNVGAVIASLNLANPNTWTATQTFPNGSILNIELANSSTTVNGQACALGGSCTITAASAFSALTGGTNTTAAMAVGSGASLIPTGSGLNIGTGLWLPKTAPSVTPSSVGPNGLCPTGVIPLFYSQNPAGSFDAVGGLDPTAYTNMGGNHLMFCNPVFFNADNSLPLYGHNALVAVIGHNGNGVDAQTNDNRAISFNNIVDSGYSPGVNSTLMGIYGEVDINGAPTLGGDIITPLNESVDVATGTVGDNRTGGSSGPMVGGRFSYTQTSGGGGWSSCNLCAVGLEASAQVSVSTGSVLPQMAALLVDWLAPSTSKVQQAEGILVPMSGSAGLNIGELLNAAGTGSTDYGYFAGGNCSSGVCAGLGLSPGTTYAKNIFANQTALYGGNYGSIDITAQLQTPVFLTTQCSGAGCPGSTHYTYAIAESDQAGHVTTAGSGVCTNCTATLTGTNFAQLGWSNSTVDTWATCNIYRTASSGTPSTTGLIGQVPCYNDGFNDTGLAIINSSTPPGTNQTGSLSAYAIYLSGCGAGTYAKADGSGCGNPSGSGTVTSVGQTVNSGSSSGIFAVTGSPVTGAGTLNINLSGTSGGVGYFSSSTVFSSSGAMASGQFMLGGGAGNPPTTSFSVVPVANGGTGTGSTLSGYLLGGNPLTATAAVGTKCYPYQGVGGTGCDTPAGVGGTVTSVGLSVNSGSSSGIASITGSPVTASGTLNINFSGTSGGLLYFSSGTVVSSSTAQTTHGVWLAEGAGNAPVTTAIGTAGYPLVANTSADPTYQQLASAGLNVTTTSCTNQVVTAISAGAVGTCSSVANAMLSNSSITIAGTSVALGGSTSSLPSPGVIGGTTPAAATFTAMTANTSITCTAATCLGSATATTQSADDNSTKVATTAYVDRLVTRVISFVYGTPGGTAFTSTPTLGYQVIPFACTIKGYNLITDATNGTITFKAWKVASGTAIPTSGNSISTSGVSITSGNTVSENPTTATDFTTTTVTAGDIVAIAITANASTNTAWTNYQLICAQ